MIPYLSLYTMWHKQNKKRRIQINALSEKIFIYIPACLLIEMKERREEKGKKEENKHRLKTRPGLEEKNEITRFKIPS